MSSQGSALYPSHLRVPGPGLVDEVFKGREKMEL